MLRARERGCTELVVSNNKRSQTHWTLVIPTHGGRLSLYNRDLCVWQLSQPRLNSRRYDETARQLLRCVQAALVRSCAGYATRVANRAVTPVGVKRTATRRREAWWERSSDMHRCRRAEVTSSGEHAGRAVQQQQAANTGWEAVGWSDALGLCLIATTRSFTESR